MKSDHALLDQLPDDALLPVAFVRQIVAGLHTDNSNPLSDLTCEEVASAIGRRPSTVRAWAASGQLEAYKLGRQWRIRRQDLREFQDRARQEAINKRRPRPHRTTPVDLSSWRSVRGKA